MVSTACDFAAFVGEGEGKGFGHIIVTRVSSLLLPIEGVGLCLHVQTFPNLSLFVRSGMHSFL